MVMNSPTTQNDKKYKKFTLHTSLLVTMDVQQSRRAHSASASENIIAIIECVCQDTTTSTRRCS